MGMEHRWNARKSINMAVTINGSSGPLHGRIKNIGLGGLCVAIRARLHRNSMVELILALPQGTLSRIVRVQAMVVWVAHEAVGLMFCHFDKGTLQVLQHLLYAKDEVQTERPVAALTVPGRDRASPF